ncbi:MAG: superoxide dismutase [Bacteroidales bacterium]|nr:superoxide dismutase [Bacteroidales bacterium]
MAFELPKLPYELESLDPVIDKRTMEFHYGKHHQAYVNNLNNLIPGTKWENASLEDMIKGAEGGIFNNAAQVWNHTFYFFSFRSGGSTEPEGALAEAIKTGFGSFSEFKEQFSKAAATVFGSGWAWLSKDSAGKLLISQESNAGNPLRSGLTPILTCDVWEHAYYLVYQNRRPDYIKDFWNIINWEVVSARF